MPEIKEFSFLTEIENLPLPSNNDYLRIGQENWEVLAPEINNWSDIRSELGNSVIANDLLHAIFGNSPYLSQCIFSDPAFFLYLLQKGSEKALEKIYEDLKLNAAPALGMTEIMKALRVAKKRIALLTATADIGNAWPLLKITKTLSDFAGAAVDHCLAHLLFHAHQKGDIELSNPDDPTPDSGVIILGMGKLGAFELNYSSDIDLIVLYDSEKVVYTGRKFMDEFFIRLTRNLVKMMQERTQDGYVFRTDLRLRPDPGATPLALPLAAAHTYYESQGQNWERAAMIKARPIAGDINCGHEFTEFLRPFVWRKFLDFAAIADIQAIKSQIHTHKGFSKISLDGHNIKIGRGGIREIEFFCQTQQLIEGGRNPSLRSSSTLGTLDLLTENGNIEGDVRDDLHKAYIFLRTLEHRLQMINDEQTQLLPDRPDDLDRLGMFMGYNDPAEFRETLESTLKTVQGHYDRLFQFEETEGRKAGRLVFTGSDDDPETLQSIAELGFEEPAMVSQTVREWHHGRYRATRTTRAQQLLTELMPKILETLADTASPDAAFKRFDAFLKKLPAGVQLFSLFSAYPSLLNLVAKIMGMAPELADRLSTNSTLLDGVLTSDFMEPLEDRQTLADDLAVMLATGRDFQDVLDISRRWAKDQKFRVGVQILDNIDHGTELGATVAAGACLTTLAEVVMQALLPLVEAELGVRHGSIPNGRFAVLAAGKLGSREMTPRSDADLIFIYDTPEEGIMTDGDKPIPAGLYYTRLSQRFINAISALTGEGSLYEVDMRLRPHGNSGPIALPLDGFEKYYMEEAWTWEHLALTRARPIAGDASLMKQAADKLAAILQTKRDTEKITDDLLDMRRRLQKEHEGKPYWALKHHEGGLMDLEFICQYLKLRHGATNPEILEPNTISALEKLGDAGLIDPKDARDLTSAMKLYLNLQGLIRLSLNDRVVTDDIPIALKEALAIAGGQPDFPMLCDYLQDRQYKVSQIFSKLVKA
ncbi:bifunctional [glutamine synthetase] adenylyltransferase/[glutamine synthetase]-adenylyl-L-tyrosine phosphorylase [Sneathiella sp. P13V-1]|uniref:bifunctional [glutamine synthetase] adenylyltransferase/[glutamine synthetase]-adenylyl-L-tyrosine phosphorylase n=1 Tax=Sneathiella sp. P13V-1 TaxID=2697366 RepID=UPI00187BA142|nr:bifunctional [glutamine synthetase] adenylyltransferase/[glutamine synthetase]-adenylyl-L-tyrosine phosphorylase [Sneathiella sp. P13V-1]MBE7637024.1 bifunctional [glutamine synthetase] adenylyltransferase/[glutamine synthetase]-adenylyl-L-tyrosine phosphorylase [Sneathiella sp. P13V-1]